MSNFEQRDNSGVLFKNDRREKDSQPNARGNALIGGVLYEVSAWTKTSKGGKVYQSLSFKVASEDQPRRQPQQTQRTPLDDFGDEVPF